MSPIQVSRQLHSLYMPRCLKEWQLHSFAYMYAYCFVSHLFSLSHHVQPFLPSPVFLPCFEKVARLLLKKLRSEQDKKK